MLCKESVISIAKYKRLMSKYLIDDLNGQWILDKQEYALQGRLDCLIIAIRSRQWLIVEKSRQLKLLRTMSAKPQKSIAVQGCRARLLFCFVCFGRRRTLLRSSMTSLGGTRPTIGSRRTVWTSGASQSAICPNACSLKTTRGRAHGCRRSRCRPTVRSASSMTRARPRRSCTTSPPRLLARLASCCSQC
jgi:hypothetical protein